MRIFGIILLSYCLIEVISCGRIIREAGDKRVETLDDEGKVLLSWEVDMTTETITFEIEAETTGYVGFGISPQGSMTGADIFIAGVLPDGTPYHSDRFGIGFTEPKVDKHQDWTLLEAKEFSGISTITYLKFSRLLYTCDDEDYPITNDTNRLIWALGATDEIQYHTANRRGARSTNLLGAVIPEVNLEDAQRWEMTLDMPMPSEDTAYWCSFHKGPVLQKKHHILAFDAAVRGASAIKHTHHFSIYNCYENPSITNQTLDELLKNKTIDTGYNGNYCHYDDPTNSIRLEDFCSEPIYVWAKGGKKFVLPEELGYPIGREGESFQYYMLEIHYDNPEEVQNLRFKTGVEFYYTDKLRPTEAGMLLVGHEVSPVLTVPPNTAAFVTAGHCAPSCTEKFPEGGITIFNSLLHSHLSGRKLKTRHFRDGKELPWIDFDDHYDFDYQQNKPLTQAVKILQGDQLTYECTYDSTWRNGTVVIGDLSTRDEMCETFLWYYPKMENIFFCLSMYPPEQAYSELGITNYTKVPHGFGPNKIYITEPENMRGDYEESVSFKFNWTSEFREEFQNKRRFGVHEAICGGRLANFPYEDNVTYPDDLVPYVPEDVCQRQGPSSTTEGGSGSSSTEGAAVTTKSSLTILGLLFILISAVLV